MDGSSFENVNRWCGKKMLLACRQHNRDVMKATTVYPPMSPELI